MRNLFAATLGGCVLGIVLLISQSAPTAGATVQSKKACHYVKKTVKKHGHKRKRRVRVCHAVKAATPRPTFTPTSTPTATPTETPTPIPTPTNTPTPRLVRNGQTLTDTETGVSVTIQKLEYGYEDNYTLPPNNGNVFQWIEASETDSGAAYVSSYFNFELQDQASGAVYAVSNGFPYGETGQIMPVVTLNGGQTNQGWMEAQTPNVVGHYYVMWNEDGAIPWVSIVKFDISPTGFVRETLLTPRLSAGR